MEDDAAVIYGVELQARALAAHTAETDAVRYFVGTQSLKPDIVNQIHQVDFDEEHNQITKKVYHHELGEIWGVTCSPTDAQILSTTYNQISLNNNETQAALWRLPNNLGRRSQATDDTKDGSSLQLICHLPQPEPSDVNCVFWQPSDGNTLITLTDKQILEWKLNAGGSATITNSTTLEGCKGQPKFVAGCWNPHHNCTQIATANETSIRVWDLRSMQQAYSVEQAHGQLVRDLDFNPNKQYYLASCGDDCKTKVWDIRDMNEPLKVFSEHSHWVWKVQYNHFHDQLLLTSSSDSRVILNNLVSLSSEPFGHLVDDMDEDLDDGLEHEASSKTTVQDGVIATYEEHEDSVYAVEWSTADPWLFASLSYDGRFVINRVPRSEKYKILL